jgi:glycosyltransferase involved in cell wall biosynthesis
MIEQLGMHLKASTGGVDRYFSALNSTLHKLSVPVRGNGFGEPADCASESWMRCLGPSRTPLLRRWQSVHRYVVPERGRFLASHFSLYALPAVLGRKWDGHVVHFHGPWASESEREGERPQVVLFKRMVEKAVYQRANRFIVLSNAFRDQLCDGYGISEDLVRVVPGGVETDKFIPMDEVQARTHLGWPQTGKILVCVRRLARRMGLENLIDAFGEATADHPSARLMIGGQGPLRAELEQQVQSSGLSDRVHFLGFVPEKDLPMVYAAANLSIVPSAALEGFGLISLESLACGTPVLVTPVGGLPDTVAGLGRQLVLEGTTVGHLAAGLSGWLDGSLHLPSREECRRHAVNGFSWDRIAKQVCDVYREAGWNETDTKTFQ